MKIAIVGPGALGCLIAGFLKIRTKEEVWLFDDNPGRAAKIKESGIKIEGISGNFDTKIDVVSSPKDIGICGLVVICVKSYSTEEEYEMRKKIFTADCSSVCLLSGKRNTSDDR